MSAAPAWPRAVVAAWLLALGLCPAGATPPPSEVSRVVGSSIEIVDAAGHLHAGLGLAGLELTLGDNGPRLRIVSVIDAGAGVLLHEIEALHPAGGWANVCEPDRDQRRLALFIEGYDLPDGRQVREAGRVSITCSAGVQGKCLRAGYHPWDESRGPGTGQALFQACTRMFRADYCGDGIGWTRNGMPVDIFDVHGIQQAADPATWPLEAAWGPDGAVCVHHTRVLQRGTMAALLAHCPRLAEPPVGKGCTEAVARGLPGALMFIRSADEAQTGR